MSVCLGSRNAAQRRYVQGCAVVMSGYLLSVLVTTTFVRHHPEVHGAERAGLALLPSLPIFILMAVVARYLHEEKDEYQRDQLVRCMLWGIAVVLCLGCFTSFLKSYGWKSDLPPFTEFCGFWFAVMISKAFYRFTDRTAAGE